MSGIPVMIHLDPATFKKLEHIAATKGVAMRRLIEAHIERSLQAPAKPIKMTRRSAGEPRDGRTRPWTRLDERQQKELRGLLILGWSTRELADRYKCSVGTIENWRKRFAERES